VPAPIEAVWKAISQQLSSWFVDTAEIDLQPGGDGALSWGARATNQATSARISVTTVDPLHTFSFRRLHPAGEEANERNSMLVKFALATEGDSTRVRLVETAPSKIEWPEEQKAKYADQSSHGWEIHLAHLKDYVSGQQTRHETSA
jgi:uncharacterized protein YndB with AHSA1/START domain